MAGLRCHYDKCGDAGAPTTAVDATAGAATTAAKYCAQCKYASYCSRECQVAAWPEHKELCRRMSADAKAREQTEDVKRVKLLRGHVATDAKLRASLLADARATSMFTPHLKKLRVRPIRGAMVADVNCEDVNGPIRVTGSDPHGLDRGGDGRACE